MTNLEVRLLDDTEWPTKGQPGSQAPVNAKPTLLLLVLAPFLTVAGEETEAAASGAPSNVRRSHPAPSDWPSYRRDGGLSGFSPLRGGLDRAPTKLWTVDVGGQLSPSEQVHVEDVNGDGTDELLRVLSDRLVCQTIEGDRLWESKRLSAPLVYRIADFAGDGSRGVLVAASTGVDHRKYIVSGVTGKATLLYASRNVFGGYERFGKILPAVAGEQLCAWWSGDPVKRFGIDGMRGVGSLWSFEKGVEQPTLQFHAEEVGTIYAPLHLIADMNRDGNPDMVMISHEQVWIWDLETGKRIMQSAWGPQIRTYWAITAALPLKPGELPALLMINPMIPGVQVVTQQRDHMVSRWKKVVGTNENQYQKQVTIERGAPDPFVDLDRDGEIEILVSVTNEQGDGQPHLVVFGADQGERRFDEIGLAVITVDDLDGDGKLEVLLQDRARGLRISRWEKNGFVDLCTEPDAAPLLVPAPPEGLLLRAVGARSAGVNMPLWRESKGSALFLLRFSDGVFGCRWTPGGVVERVQRVEKHEALKNDNTEPKAYAWDGHELGIERDGTTQVTYRRPQIRRYLPPAPIVGTHGRRRRIVVREFSGALVSYSVDGTDRNVLLKNTPATTGPTLCDLDGDGAAELLGTGITDAGKAEVVAVGDNGERRWTIAAPDNAIETLLGPTGSLGPAAGRWLSVRYRISYENTRVTTYDGKTAKTLWTRRFLGSEMTPSTTFVLHIPTAVHDVDGDGADDLLASSENWYEVISAKDDRTITANTTITAVVPGHWGAYATPMVVDFEGDGSPLVFHNNAYALTMVTHLDGRPVWHYGLTRDTTHASKAGFADMDGDGTVEIVTSQKDGLLRAFDAAPRPEKCPKCPPDEPLGDDNHSGHVRWTFQLPPPVSDFATLDLDGDGKVELLCGAGDGSLYALKERDRVCSVLWRVELGRRVGGPIACDLNGDSTPEILVVDDDGKLHCLGREPQ